jgi:hypothetical protein
MKHVMAGLDPAIQTPKPKVWMPGSSPGMTTLGCAPVVTKNGALNTLLPFRHGGPESTLRGPIRVEAQAKLRRLLDW